MILNIVKIKSMDYATTGSYDTHVELIGKVSNFLSQFQIDEIYHPVDQYADKSDEQRKAAWYGFVESTAFVVDDSRLCRMFGAAKKAGVEIDVQQQYDHDAPARNEQSDIVVAMRQILDRMNRAEFLRGNSFNEKCEVHVGGFALLSIDSVMLCEDCCTDRLQGHLNEGWRILSVNVQPDQRRSDYILGRSTPPGERAKNSGA